MLAVASGTTSMKMRRAVVAKTACLARLRGGTTWPPDRPPHYYEEAHLSPEDRKRLRNMQAAEKRRQEEEEAYRNAPVPYKVFDVRFGKLETTIGAIKKTMTEGFAALEKTLDFRSLMLMLLQIIMSIITVERRIRRSTWDPQS